MRTGVTAPTLLQNCSLKETSMKKLKWETKPTRELMERLNFSHTLQTMNRYSKKGDSPVRIASRKLGLLAYKQPVISSTLVGKNGSN